MYIICTYFVISAKLFSVYLLSNNHVKIIIIVNFYFIIYVYIVYV